MFEPVWMLPDVLLVMAVHGIQVNASRINGKATNRVTLIHWRPVLHLQVAGRSPPRGRLHGREEFLVEALPSVRAARRLRGRDSPACSPLHARDLPLLLPGLNGVLICRDGVGTPVYH